MATCLAIFRNVSRCITHNYAKAPKLCNVVFNAQCRLLSSAETRKPQCSELFKGKACAEKMAKKTVEKVKPPAPEPLPPAEREIRLKVPDECCDDPCKDALPRFDLLYYKRSDKSKRKYQQTWAECPELLKKPKLICCFDKIKHPQLEKRAPKERPKTACAPPCAVGVTKCPRVTMEKCRKARVPPKCDKGRKVNKCKKKNAPYPSFSECKRPHVPPKHPIECKCLSVVPMCDVWAYYHKQQKIKKIAKGC